MLQVTPGPSGGFRVEMPDGKYSYLREREAFALLENLSYSLYAAQADADTEAAIAQAT